jgi:phosphatidylserine/phosphatidylglycerophosphate/cardiolipin synthase-like enzyme
MEKDKADRRNFLTGALGYMAGAVAGFLFIFLADWLGLVDLLFGLIDQNQTLVQILAVPVLAGILLVLAGLVMGGVGGWVLAKILGTPFRLRLATGSGIAFSLTQSVLLLVFILVVAFIALYNNFTNNKIEQFIILFGLFGLVFGLLTGILQAFMTVRLRHTWRVILSAILGYTLGGALLGFLIWLTNPTEGFKTYPILTFLTLLLGLAAPYFLGGGFLGVTYGRIGRRASEVGEEVQSVQASRWVLVFIAVIGVVVTYSFFGLIGDLASFLTIQPGNLGSQLPTLTVGVGWSEPQAYSGEYRPPASDQEPAKATGADQVEHQAWCSAEGIIHYQGGSMVEQLPFPGCSSAPGIALDGDGVPHLVWYADEVTDTNGVTRSTSVLVESIRTPGGWSNPAIAARTNGPVTPLLAADAQGLLMVWEDQGNLLSARQGYYKCSEADLSDLERVSFKRMIAAGYRQDGAKVPYCGNHYERLLYTPNPEPEYSDKPITPNGAFDVVSAIAETAQYEVLFTTMQWESNETPPSPGSVLAEGVADLYHKVKANPDDYPRGMTVRIMLGNYPELSYFQWGTQIYDAINDMREAGVEKMVDPEIGWRLEIANFPGTYPHSHTKFVVVDGKTVTGVGFNYGYLHLPKDHPSGKGYDMLDLGVEVSGPVAQDAISTYDDMWNGADQIHCADFHPADGSDWTDTCQEVKGTGDHVPEVLRTYLPPDGDSNAFSLYRTTELKEGDTFIATALASAEESIDMTQVNFALEMICMANIVFPDLCTFDDALPYMKAMVEAVEKNHVHVRVIMENSNSNGLENRVGGTILMEELERREPGLSDLVELRFYNGKIHAKGSLIDDQLLIIGSQNMHYSSWGEGGLTEYSLATDNPQAIAEYQALFEDKWQEAIPFEEAEYATTP